MKEHSLKAVDRLIDELVDIRNKFASLELTAVGYDCLDSDVQRAVYNARRMLEIEKPKKEAA